MNDNKNQSSDHFNVMVNSDCSIFCNLESFLGELFVKQCTEQDPKSETIKEHKFKILSVKHGDKQKSVYGLNEDAQFYIKYLGEIVKCKIIKISKDHGTEHEVQYLYRMFISVKNKKIFDSLLKDATHQKDTLMMYNFNTDYFSWLLMGSVPEREPSSLIMDPNEKENILNDVDDFLSSEKDYKEYGIPYKRNYLFHGIPGTGKSSLTNIIACRAKMNIYIVPFDENMTDGMLYLAISKIRDESAMLLLEDIDCIFQNKGTNTNLSKVSRSAILNVLDGVGRVKGMISVITTNFIDVLDNALFRPGRVDMIIEFKPISADQITGLLKMYDIKLKKTNLKKLTEMCTSRKLTPAVLSHFLFRNRKKKMSDLIFMKTFKEYLNEIEKSIGSEKTPNEKALLNLDKIVNNDDMLDKFQAFIEYISSENPKKRKRRS